ncbi:MAG: prepilin peptidase [Blautia sp.]|nr:prepilin peptidase [Blautia sp.]
MIINICREAAVLMLLSLNTYTDLKRNEILLFSIPAGMGTGLVCAFLSGELSGSWLAGLVPGIVFILLSILSQGCIGMGDGLLLLALGALLSWHNVTACLLLALILSALCAIMILVIHRGKMYDVFPFAPFLLAGHLLTLMM